MAIPIDTARIPNWAKNSYIQQYLPAGSPGFEFIGYKDKIYGVPTVLQGDSFAYLEDVTGPLGLTVVISFWKRTGFKLQPAFTLNSYAEFFSGVRLLVLERSLLVSIEATALSLLIAYPIAYFIAKRIKPELTRSILMLFTIPFLVNYVIRTFAWTYLLGRTGPINSILIRLELVDTGIVLPTTS